MAIRKSERSGRVGWWKDSSGFSLIEVIVAAGIMAVVLSSMAAMTVSQGRETKAMAEKLAAEDLQRVLAATLSDGAICAYSLNHPAPLTFDATKFVPGTPTILTPTLPIFGTLLPVPSVPIAKVGTAASSFSDSLFIKSIALRIKDGPPPPIASANNLVFLADWVVEFDSTKTVRQVRPVTIATTIRVDATVLSAAIVTECMGTNSTGGILPFNFTNATNVAENAAVASDAVTLAGFSGTLTATCGANCVGISRNKLPYVAGPVSGFVAGDTISIAQVTSKSSLTTTSASLTVGNYSTSWLATTGNCVPGSVTFGTMSMGDNSKVSPACGTYSVAVWGGGGWGGGDGVNSGTGGGGAFVSADISVQRHIGATLGKISIWFRASSGGEINGTTSYGGYNSEVSVASQGIIIVAPGGGSAGPWCFANTPTGAGGFGGAGGGYNGQPGGLGSGGAAGCSGGQGGNSALQTLSNGLQYLVPTQGTDGMSEGGGPAYGSMSRNYQLRAGAGNGGSTTNWIDRPLRGGSGGYGSGTHSSCGAGGASSFAGPLTAVADPLPNDLNDPWVIVSNLVVVSGSGINPGLDPLGRNPAGVGHGGHSNDPTGTGGNGEPGAIIFSWK